MPAWQNVKRALMVVVALGWALLLWSSTTAQAEFRVADVKSRFVGSALVVNGNLELGLSPKVEEALAKGIELPVIIELRLYRKRSYLWDLRLGSWTVRRVLQYHALSGQYLLNTGSADENYLSAAEALRNLGTLSDLQLPLQDIEIDNTAEYSLRLRAHLDIEALPAPLRPVAYTTPSWHLNSGWSAWSVLLSAE